MERYVIKVEINIGEVEIARCKKNFGAIILSTTIILDETIIEIYLQSVLSTFTFRK